MKICSFDIETTHYLEKEGQVIEFGLILFDTKMIRTVSDIYKAPKLRILVHDESIYGNWEAIKLNANVLEEINTLVQEDKQKPFDQKFKNQMRSITDVNENNLTTYLVDKYNFTRMLVLWLHNNGIYEFTNNSDYKQRSYNDTINLLSTYITKNNYKDIYGNYKIYADALLMAGKNIATFDLPFLREYIPGFNDVIKVKKRIIDPAIIYTNRKDNVPPDLTECKSRLGLDDTVVAHTGLDDTIDVNLLLFFHLRLESLVTSYVIYNQNDDTYDIQICEASKLNAIVENERAAGKIVITNNKLYEMSMKSRFDIFNEGFTRLNKG